MTTSMAETLTGIAIRDSLDIGSVTPGQNGREAISAHLRSARGDITVAAEPDGRFQVLLAGRGFAWARGWTTDPAEAARTIAAWRAGVTLRELTASFPFMGTSELAQAHEDGRALEYLWEQLLGLPDIEPLARALHDHPVLCRLTPSVSHGNFLRLAVGGRGPEYAEVHVIQLRDGIQVEGSWGGEPKLVPTISEAVAEAAALVQGRRTEG